MRLAFAQRSLPLGGPPHVMGILNLGEDSVYAPSRFPAPDLAVARGLELVAAGAGLVDVGAMSARPGEPIAVEEEAGRLVPVLRALRRRLDVPLAVDTYRAAVADAALTAGADLVNDHTGLSDPALADAVADHDAGLVVTHLALPPKAEQTARYDIAPSAIVGELGRRAERARAAGVRADAILVDPGLGFGKSVATDLATLRELPRFRTLGYPLLLAASHKEVTAEPLELEEWRLEGTAAVVAVAGYLGVDVLRLHDLPFMRHVATMGWLIGPSATAADGAGQAVGGERSGANSGRKAPSR